MRSIKVLIPALVLAALPAQAGVVFTDGFEGESLISELNFNSFDDWTVSGGTVDLIKSGDFSINCRTGSFCVDLDGSTNNSGLLAFSTPIAFSAGDVVSGEWYLSGNQRNAAIESVFMGLDFGTGAPVTGFTWNLAGQPDIVVGDFTLLGSASLQSSITTGDVFGRFGFSFTAGGAGTLKLSFNDLGNDNIGAILDDVSISVTSPNGAVPEPATWAMLITGFGLVGFVARRRRGVAVAA